MRNTSYRESLSSPRQPSLVLSFSSVSQHTTDSTTGASQSQTRVVMPTITHQSLSASMSAQLNSIMLKHAHHFYYPLNTISLFSNILVSLVWLFGQEEYSYTSPVLASIQSLLPAILCVLSTVHTVKWILPINERVHSLAVEMMADVDKQSSTAKESQESEIRSLQQRWELLNGIRGALLFSIAVGVITSPAVASLYKFAAV